MWNNTIPKKTAWTAVIIALFVVFAITVWPLRLWRESFSFDNGSDTILVCDSVEGDVDAGEYFKAQYAHLLSIDLWIEEVAYGQTFQFQLFSPREDGGMELLAEEELAFPAERPGMVTVPVDVETEPGKTYVFVLRGPEASFRMPFVAADAAAFTELGFHHDSGIEGAALRMAVHYDAPLRRAGSLMLLGIAFFAAFLAIVLVFLYFGKYPERNRMVTILSILQVVLTPVSIGIAGFFLVNVLAGRFDERLSDKLFYSTGIILGLVFILYGLWHKRTEVKKIPWKSLPHYLIMVLIAFVFVECSDYMNALNDLVHHRCEYMIVILLCLILLCMGEARQNLSLPVGAAGIIGAILGFFWYWTNRVPSTEKEYLELNQNLRLQIIAWILFALVVLSTALALWENAAGPGRGRKRTERAAGNVWTLWLLLPMAVFYAFLFAFRNGRWWITVLTAMTILFVIRFYLFSEREQWLYDVASGIILNFVYYMAYSMLHRYYFAFLYSRFSMQFHTVTVTAYYLLLVEAAVLSLYLKKREKAAGLPLREKLPLLYKEAFLFGAATSYMMMTISRAGIGVCAIYFVIAAFVVCGGKGRRLTGPIRGLASMVVVTLLVFPVIFTGQRLVSTAAHSPERFEQVEPYPDEVLRNMQWDSKWFMSIEIFLRDFGDRVIGGEIGSKWFDYYHLDQGQGVKKVDSWVNAGYVAGPVTGPLEKPAGFLSRVKAFEEEAAVPDSLDDGDYSNGRITIWRCYLNDLTWNGHDVMGTMLPDGEIAVHAHNSVIQVMFDNGIITGILFAVYLLLLLVRSCLYYRESDPFSLIPLMVVIGFILNGMVEWIFHLCNPYTLMLLFVTLPLLYGRKEPAKQNG